MPEWVEVAIRTLIFLIILFLVAKWIGKKQVSQLSFFEFVIGIAMGTVTGVIVMGFGNIFHGIVGIIIFGATPFLLEWLSLKSKGIRDVVEGKGTIFIKDGKVMEENLKQERYTTDKLMGLLRKKDIFQISDVQFAVLEPSGELNVLLKKENLPLTAKELGVNVSPIKEPQTVIMDGEVLDEPLSTVGLNRNWLHTELEKLGVTMENVFLGQVDAYGQLTVDLFDDKLQVAEPVEKPLILSTLKKCQADLELFALSTERKEAKQTYSENSEKLQRAIDKVTPLLRE